MSKTGFLFDGQGAFKPGFGKKFMEVSAFKDSFDEICKITGLPLDEWAWGKESIHTPNKNSRLQITLFALNLSIAKMTAHQSGVPQMVTGHSLGEVCALVYASSLTLQQGCQLILKRGEVMEKASAVVSQDMLVAFTSNVSLLEKTAVERFQSRFTLSNFNADDQIVLSGELSSLKELAKVLKTENGIDSKILGTRVACHSPYLTEASNEFAELVRSLDFSPPVISFFSVGANRVLFNAVEIQSYLESQMLAPVYWARAMKSLESQGFSRFIEIGPSKILKGLALNSLLKTQVQTFAEAFQYAMA